MNSRATAIVLALLACSGGPAARAADAGGNYAIWGAGARSCHQFEHSAADPAARDPFRHFLMGYLTAYDTLAADTYDALGGKTLEDALRWLEDYCRGHQMDSFERAIAQLLVAHHDSRLHAPAGANRGWGRSSSAPPGGAP